MFLIRFCPHFNLECLSWCGQNRWRYWAHSNTLNWLAYKLTNKIIGFNFSRKTWNFSLNENFRILIFSNFNYRLFFLISCFVKVEQIGSLCQEKQTVEYYNWKESFQRTFYDTQVKWPIIVILQLKIMQRGGLNQTFWNWTWTNMNYFERFFMLNLAEFLEISKFSLSSLNCHI